MTRLAMLLAEARGEPYTFAMSIMSGKGWFEKIHQEHI
jgi:hypothetical protein